MTAYAVSTLRMQGAFVERNFRVSLSYRVPFVLELVGAVVSLIMFRFISELVGERGQALAQGDYFSFAAVGIAMAIALYSAVNGPIAAVRQEQVQGSLEALVAQPVSASQLALGFSAFPAFYGVVQAMILLSVAWLGFGLAVTGPALLNAIPALALTSIAFAALGLVGVAFVLVFQQGGFIAQWATSGVAIVSGAYFPLALFPDWVQTISRLSPLTHALKALRGTLLEQQPLGDHAGSLIALGVFGAIFFVIGVSVMRVALDRARKRGSLAHY